MGARWFFLVANQGTVAQIAFFSHWWQYKKEYGIKKKAHWTTATANLSTVDFSVIAS